MVFAAHSCSRLTSLRRNYPAVSRQMITNEKYSFRFSFYVPLVFVKFVASSHERALLEINKVDVASLKSFCHRQRRRNHFSRQPTARHRFSMAIREQFSFLNGDNSLFYVQSETFISTFLIPPFCY